MLRHLVAFASCAALLASHATAQTCSTLAAVENLGGGSTGTNGVPQLSTKFVTTIGNPFGLRLTDALPGSVAVFGASATAAPVPVPSFGATIWPQLPFFAFEVRPVNGAGVSAGFLGTGALAPSLCGVEFFAQAIVADGAALGGFAYSDAVRVAIGARELDPRRLYPGARARVDGAADAIAHGDFDGDGDADLATIDSAGATVSILLNDGDGIFDLAQVVALPAGAFDLAAGDVDGDGDIDLFMSGGVADRCAVLRGDGSGAFLAPIAVDMGPNEFAVATADLDADGAVDLVAGSVADNQIVVRRGLGGGAFAPPAAFGTGPVGPRALEIADADGDGDLDVLTANNSAFFGVSVLFNDGSAQFPSVQALVIGGGIGGVAVGDFDGDGIADVVRGGTQGLEVAFATAPGAWGAAVKPTNPIVHAIEVFDANGDGFDDALIATWLPYAAELWTSNGDGTFDGPERFATGREPVEFAAVDVDGDGDRDLAVANDGSADVSVLRGDGAGALATYRRYEGAAGQLYLALVDLDGDGEDDLVTSNYLTGEVLVFAGDGGGSYGSVQTIALSGDPQRIATGDFDLDGHADVAVAQNFAGEVQVLLGNGDGTLAVGPLQVVPGAASAVVAADANGDGVLDLVVGSSFVADGLFTLAGNGDGTFASPQQSSAPSGTVTGVVVRDLDGDGNLDALRFGLAGAGASVHLGLGDGSFATTPDPFTIASVSAAAVGDLDGDGVLDLVAIAQNQFEITTALGLVGGGFAPPVTSPFDGSAAELVLRDANGDGALDAIATLDTTDNALAVALGNGDGTFSPATLFQTGALPTGVLVEDVTGDRIPDVLTANIGTGDVTLLIGGELDRP